eukprot:5344998-Pleurochrysis_carterae.AAC.1
MEASAHRDRLLESRSSSRSPACATRCPTMGGAVSSEVNCVRRESSSAVTGARDSATRTSAGRVASELSRSAYVVSTRSLCACAERAGTLVCAHVSLGCAAL